MGCMASKCSARVYLSPFVRGLPLRYNLCRSCNGTSIYFIEIKSPQKKNPLLDGTFRRQAAKNMKVLLAFTLRGQRIKSRRSTFNGVTTLYAVGHKRVHKPNEFLYLLISQLYPC